MSDFFVNFDSVIYDIGCSTGTLTLELSEHSKHKPNARFVGIDIEDDMVEAARNKAKEHTDLNIARMSGQEYL